LTVGGAAARARLVVTAIAAVPSASVRSVSRRVSAFVIE
jgi:hypothetical protein